MKNYIQNIKEYGFFFEMEDHNFRLMTNILWSNISICLAGMENLQYLSLKDYYPRSNVYKLMFTEEYQELFLQINIKNLKELKIYNNFFRLKYINNQKNTDFYQI